MPTSNRKGANRSRIELGRTGIYKDDELNLSMVAGEALELAERVGAPDVEPGQPVRCVAPLPTALVIREQRPEPFRRSER